MDPILKKLTKMPMIKANKLGMKKLEKLKL